MSDLSVYPFKLLRKRFASLIIAFVPVFFLIVASVHMAGDYSVSAVNDKMNLYFGGDIHLSGTNPALYDKIGGDGLPPVMRLGGITKIIDVYSFASVGGAIVFITLVLAYLSFAMVSSLVFSHGKKHSRGFGINFATLSLAVIAALVIMVISVFSLNGFQLVLLLNFGIIFLVAVPLAANGVPLGESFYQSFNFMRYNLRKLVHIYLLSMGVAIAAPIGLLIVFMFPLSVLNASVQEVARILLSLFGITFALYYQFASASRMVYEFVKREQIPSNIMFRSMARKIKR